jgi:hypothetical protein
MLAGPDDDEQRAGRMAGTRGLAIIALGISISLDQLAIGFSLGLTRLPAVPVIIAIAARALIASSSDSLWAPLSASTCVPSPSPTAVAHLAEQGVSVRVVREILGHSQLSQTERYTNVTRALSQHAADRMSEALWG